MVRNHQRPLGNSLVSGAFSIAVMHRHGFRTVLVPRTCHARAPRHVVEPSRQFLIKSGKQVSVRIERRRYGRVPQTLRDGLGMRAGPDRQSGRGVAQVVEGQRVEGGSLGDEGLSPT